MKNWKIDGLGLKLIAVISMFIDHFGAVVVERILMAGYAGTNVWASEHYNAIVSVYMILRGIGRLAFPIYCFLIIEGLMHTRNLSKYLLRLGIFAVISEIPFDMAFNDILANGSITKIVEFSYNNVFLTLFIGLLAAAAMKLIDDNMVWEGDTIGAKYKWHEIGKTLWKLMILFAGMGVAELLNTDYGASGVAAIGVIYMLYKKPWLAMLGAVMILACLSSELEAVALVDIAFVYFYNGQRGKNSTFLKYFFYVFYPAHLLLIEGIAIALGYK